MDFNCSKWNLLIQTGTYFCNSAKLKLKLKKEIKNTLKVILPKEKKSFLYQFNSYNINSIDEIINDFILNRQNEFEGITTIYIATFYNYVSDNKIPDFDKKLFPMHNK